MTEGTVAGRSGGGGAPTGPVHAFTDDALGDHDATEVAGRIRRGAVSPVEICKAAVRRAERMQPPVNAVEYADYERALAAAETCADGAFRAVPTFVKDNVDVAGVPTNHGTDAFVAAPAGADSPFATQLKALGFNVLGKSRLPEFGFSASTEYVRRDPVRNPWHLEHSAGASSGGAAALVASGVVPLAHANDGGGSIRIPAAACGLVGLKPTRGRLVPDLMERRLPVPIAAQGVLTRTVRDTARFYAAAEEYWRNPRLPPVRSVEGPTRTRLRIGVVTDSVNGTPTDDDTRACVLAAARLLDRLGHHVEETANPVPRRFVADFSLYWGLLGLLVSSTGARVLDPGFDVSRTDNLTRGAGGPAISLPLGRTHTGLPIGCHFSADVGDERTLLELAYELEEAQPWARIQDAPRVQDAPRSQDAPTGRHQKA